MGASGPVWSVIVAVIVGLVLIDYLFSVRRSHTPTLREAAVWSAIYLGIAIAFGIGVWAFGGTSMGVEYFACYVSNEALSIDNLFVFLFIVSSFAVPRIAQQKVLLFGILLALAARSGFIFIGAALIAVFDWAFYLFGIVLLIMATNLARQSESKGPRHGHVDHSYRPTVGAHLGQLRRRPAVHRRARPSGDDTDAAGHDRRRRG